MPSRAFSCPERPSRVRRSSRDRVRSACFKPWSEKTKYFQWEKKPGPYRIALVNGFVGNTWRIQMIKTAKAFAEQPDIKEKIKEFKVVSTGTDVAGPARRHRELHQPGLRRDRHHRGGARRRSTG